jgi:hypothetical protein
MTIYHNQELQPEERRYLRDKFLVHAEEVEEEEPEKPLKNARYAYEYREDEFHPDEIKMLKAARIPIVKNRGKARWKTRRRGHLLPGDIELLVHLREERGQPYWRIAKTLNMKATKIRSIYRGIQEKRRREHAKRDFERRLLRPRRSDVDGTGAQGEEASTGAAT